MKQTSKVSSIVLAICELVIGVLLLINPTGFTRIILTFLGIILLALGIVAAVQYFRTPAQEAAAGQGLTRGFIEVLFGLFLILFNSWFIDTFALLTTLYGVGILITGAAKVQWTVDMLRLHIKKWYFTALSAALTILFAVVILCNPALAWVAIAIFLIIEAAMDVIAVIFAK